MHIADGVLPTAVAAGCYVLTLAGLGLSLRTLAERDLPKIAVVSSSFFVASLIHLPLGPTSVHLLLPGLVGALLGPTAFLSIVVGLFLQSLLFQFGGLTALGANSLMMGLPALICGFLYRGLRGTSKTVQCSGRRPGQWIGRGDSRLSSGSLAGDRGRILSWCGQDGPCGPYPGHGGRGACRRLCDLLSLSGETRVARDHPQKGERVNLDQAHVIVLNSVQTMSLFSCLFLPFFCALVAWLLKPEKSSIPGQETGPDWSSPVSYRGGQASSLFHSWVPSVKIATLLLGAFLIVSLHTLAWALVALFACGLCVELTGMSWTRPLRRLAALGGFLGMLVVIIPLTSPVQAGDTVLLLPWLRQWPFNLAGVHLALTIVCKAMAVALLMEPMLATSSLTQTMQGFTKLGLPASLNQMILLCHRYIFVFQEEMQRMQRSMRVRGFVPRTNIATLRTMGGGFGMLFIRSFERTERVYEAMLSRGYQGRFPADVRQEITRKDLVKGGVFIMIGAMLLIGDRFFPLILF